ncbi:MAG: UDP-N-acetylglucosamine 4,6-dehydratase (inverting) [Alphaproteobacteria bacterium]|nr:UDP-N-acetylglucosamine 4,6-dehydratase (inverting) [Alphaproteobacteria bacterium]
MVINSFETPTIDLNGLSILVTGGTGSFGKAFVRTVLERYRPRRLIVFSRDELKQHEMAQEIGRERHPAIRYFIGDVRDDKRLEMAMRGVDVVVHAAALKHVPIAEYNPFECIATNVHGAENVVQASIRAGVRKVVALSTDKAANPINLYGASKLASDKIFIAANNLSGEGGCRFSVVRYGNVMGSRGSVIPLFRRLVAEGAKALPITDPRMTRFWITLQQGVNFVLSSAAMMRGGEIFVPKIPSMKMTDLAACMGPGLKLDIVGIRPGEKLHEVLITAEDARNTVELADRYVIEPAFHEWDARRADLAGQFGGRPVPEDFYFTSDSNHDWLDGERLLGLLAEGTR